MKIIVHQIVVENSEMQQKIENGLKKNKKLTEKLELKTNM